MALIEKRKNFVAFLPSGYARSGCLDCACAIGGGDNAVSLWEWVPALQGGS